MRKFYSVVMVILFLSQCCGCAAVVVAGASGGVAYTLTNVAYKTVNYPLAQVKLASHNALKNMGISERDVRPIDGGYRITGATDRLTIEVELEMITSKSTKISVDARKNIVVKDKATATELIDQIVRILQ
ncbi:MAG: DUF3568 domain-containing protein [Nitrospiraceae bacterium]|nr:DUF3568 domain-containing protein [Nitrospiraceae bacterium]